jgi:hypothetical protein
MSALLSRFREERREYLLHLFALTFWAARLRTAVLVHVLDGREDLTALLAAVLVDGQASPPVRGPSSISPFGRGSQVMPAGTK